jgi:hypothetical protein
MIGKYCQPIESPFLWIHTFTLKMVQAWPNWQMGRSLYERSTIPKNEKPDQGMFLSI